jgi:hypothetical protein
MTLHTPTETEPKPASKHRLSLRRLLLAVLFIGAFFGFTRLASSGGIAYATIPAIACLALAVGIPTRRYVLAFVVSFALAFTSYVTTSILWDGGFPFAEVRIYFVDESGNAISNVTMSVTWRSDGSSAHEYPISEYDGTSLSSDDDGVITCHQMRQGLQFGGHAWLLFWCIPMGAQSPKFDVHFEHPRFAQTTVPVWRLFESEYAMYEDFPKTTIDVNGNAEEIKIYNQRIVLPSR